jgi:hypothetical protein
MELLKQAQIAKLRGEPDFSEVLEEIASEESARLEKIEMARRDAFKVVLCDNDY